MKAISALIAVSFLAMPAAAQEKAFAAGGPTVNLAVTGTTARVQVQTSPPGNQHMRVYNSGTAAVFINCGDVAVTAALATAMPVAPGTIEIIGCAQTYIAGISGGTATVYITPGNGI